VSRCISRLRTRQLATCSALAAKKGVIFDLGGVILPSPLKSSFDWEVNHGFAKGSFFSVVKAKGKDGAWAKLERGELTLQQFYKPFSQELTETLEKEVSEQQVEKFMKNLDNAISIPNQDMLEAAKRIRKHGLKTAILTNNWKSEAFSPLLLQVLRDNFDEVVESCEVGVRKPDKQIYQLVLDKLDMPAGDVVFLDDLAGNIEAANKLGIDTIRVKEVERAIEELQALLGINLGHEPGTSTVRPGMQLDEESLMKYLTDKLGLTGDLKIKQFSHGQSNPTYLLQIGAEKMVLRKKPPGKLLPGAHAIEREHQVLRALGEAGVPVPKLINLCEDSSIVGTPFYLMEYVQGKIYKDPGLPDVPAEDRQKIYNAMLDVLAKIHKVDIFKVGLEKYGKHDNYVGRQIKTWSRQYESSKTEDIPEMTTLMDWLPKNLPRQAKTTVVHGDFRLDNIIYDKDDCSKVLAVLDWELSTLGDPMTDIAYACLAYHIPEDSAILRGLAGRDLSGSGVFTESQCLKSYLSLTQPDTTPQAVGGMEAMAASQWDFYLSFALFRVAAILQGVYKRSLDKQASGRDATEAGQLAKYMAKTSLRLAGRTNAIQQNSRQYSTATHAQATQSGAVAVSVSSLPDRVQKLHAQVEQMVREEILPLEQELRDHQAAETWTTSEKVEELKAKAKAAGLWNLFIPSEADPEARYGASLSNLEYAHICEVMGLSEFAPEVFNCNAPDTGNMEVLLKYGTEEHKKTWLEPLLEGQIRSCFAMTEPSVASSDATNIQSSIVRDGDEYVINGQKWWTTGAMDPRTELCVFMGKTDPSAAKHKQQSMILLPFKTQGITVLRPLSVYGSRDSPSGHAEVLFENVRVPAGNLLLGEGRGFEIAQGRLGPGRIHHCMRLIGMAERCLELMIARVKSRVAFGKPLVEQGTIQQDIALSRLEIEQARLLTLKAAHMMDTVGNKVAAPEIAMIKIVAPRMVQQIADRAIQAHGGAGLNSDFPLASIFGWARALRFADGPDEVHLRSLAKFELNKHKASR